MNQNDWIRHLETIVSERLMNQANCGRESKELSTKIVIITSLASFISFVISIRGHVEFAQKSLIS
jgi:hypothetical protein